MLEKMRHLPNWVVWKKSGKKIPLDPRTLKPASSTDPSTWVTLEIAQKRIQAEDDDYGLGFVLNGDGIVAVDLDDCLTEDADKVEHIAAPIIEKARAAGAYVEISPSGKGIHILYYGAKASNTCKLNLFGAKVEVYDKARYITYTGNRVFRFLDDEEAHAEFGKFVEELIEAYESEDFNAILEAVKVTPKMRKLYEGDWSDYPSQSEADLAFVSFLTQMTTNPIVIDLMVRASGLYREKWDEKRGNKTYGELTIEKALKKKPTVSTHEVEQTHAVGDDYSLTDYGNALRMLLFGKDYVFDRNKKSWYFWNPERGLWEEDTTDGIRLYERVIEHVNRTARKYSELALINEGFKEIAKAWTKHATRSQSKNAMSGAISIAQKLCTTDFEWDKHGTLLNTPDGIVDLEDGKVYPHDKNFFMRLQTNATPEEGTPKLFLSFLRSLFDDEEIVEFMQRVLGYSAIAGNAEQLFFILWGPGGNGKTTLLNIMQGVLGTYAAATQPETFVARMNAIPSDIARLRGKRFIATSEPVSKGSLNAALVKRITGGDTILVRYMYGEWFEMRVVGVPFMTTNVQPTINDMDDGIWRRIIQIPFQRKLEPEERIANYDQIILNREGGKILNWLIEGAQMYLEGGLQIPEKVMRSTQEYRRSQDTMQTFIDDVLQPSEREDAIISLTQLQQVYSKWAVIHGMRPLWMRKFMNLFAAKEVHIEDQNLIGYEFTEYGLRLLNM